VTVPAASVSDALRAAAQRLRASGSRSPRLDAELLMAAALGVDRAALFRSPERALAPQELERFEGFVRRREAREPVAYIRGRRAFRTIELEVDGAVLIPRPETETLVELAIERIRSDLTSAPRPAGAAPYMLWDVGTGSGAIAVAIALELRRLRYGDAVRFWVSDRSPDAMAVATVNIVSHGLADLFTIAAGDLTAVSPAPGPVDLLTANLPYVPSGEVPDLPIAARFEPPGALDGGPDGLALIRRLLAELPIVLAPHGLALLEIGGDQATAVERAAAALLPGWVCVVLPDLGGSPRVAQLERTDV
jgi:release factor glutamine methyltransferase